MRTEKSSQRTPQDSPLIAILGAMDCEIQGLLADITESEIISDDFFTWYTGLLHGCRVVVAKSGVGKVLAASCTQRVIDKFSPDALICTGVAGAIAEDLEIGDLVISADCIQHDMDVRALGFSRGEIPFTGIKTVAADERMIAAAKRYVPADRKICVGRILSGDQFITKSATLDGAYLQDELAGTAVEMEGASIGLVCAINKTPFIIVRTISDKADGAAALAFEAVLPIVAKNSCTFVEHLLITLSAEPFSRS